MCYLTFTDIEHEKLKFENDFIAQFPTRKQELQDILLILNKILNYTFNPITKNPPLNISFKNKRVTVSQKENDTPRTINSYIQKLFHNLEMRTIPTTGGGIASSRITSRTIQHGHNLNGIVKIYKKITDPHIKWVFRNTIYHWILLFIVNLIIQYSPVHSHSHSHCVTDYPCKDSIFCIKHDIGKYKLSNFGSINVSSDIDAACQYDGTCHNHISTVMLIIESTYNFYFESSLLLDIEFYDSYISKKIRNIETYLFDFKKLTEHEFTELLPYAIASIVRNIFLGFKNYKETHLGFKIPQYDTFFTEYERFIQEFPVFTEYQRNAHERREVARQGGSYTIHDSKTIFKKLFTNLVQQDIFEFLDHNIDDIAEFTILILKQFLGTISYFPTTFHRNKRYIFNIIYKLHHYLQNNLNERYTDNQNIYYKKLKTIETRINGDPKTRNFKLIKSITEAQLYRQEGYVLLTTVYHIPRIFQYCANMKPLDVDKHQHQNCLLTDFTHSKEHGHGHRHQYKNSCNDVDNTFQYPSCLIGHFAYILSQLEQIGFFIRFFIEYGGNIHDEHYISKFDKYRKRLLHAYLSSRRLSTQVDSQPVNHLLETQLIRAGRSRKHSNRWNRHKRHTYKKLNYFL
jgi:hypothetical protein